MTQNRSKAAIVERLEAERRTLEQLLATLPPAELLERGVVGEWSASDVLAHLADWEAHMLVWVAAARRGEAVAGPEPGLSWRQLKEFNRRIYAAHRDEPLDEVLATFRETHLRFMALVGAMPEEEMLARGRYALTAGDALYEWLVQYAQHDAWGTKRIGDWARARERAAPAAAPGQPGHSP